MKKGYQRKLYDVGPPSAASDIRILNRSDAPTVAQLMLKAYQGTVDYEGEDIDEALAWVESAFSETANPDSGESALNSCAIGIEINDSLVAACIPTLWEGEPLISTIMTHPNYKGRGLGYRVLTACLETLKQRGYRSVRAFITSGNIPSERLFTTMGFELVSCD